MPDYKEMYFQLYNRLTDVILELQQAQKDMEEMYINITQNTDVEK